MAIFPMNEPLCYFQLFFLTNLSWFLSVFLRRYLKWTRSLKIFASKATESSPWRLVSWLFEEKLRKRVKFLRATFSCNCLFYPFFFFLSFTVYIVISHCCLHFMLSRIHEDCRFLTSSFFPFLFPFFFFLPTSFLLISWDSMIWKWVALYSII